MKHVLQKSALLCAFWLMAIVIANFVKVEAFTVPTSLNNDYLQRVRLHTLHLWSWEEVELNAVKKWNIWYMGFGTWLVVWNNSAVNGNSQYVVIGWWKNNTISNYSSFAGIAGWTENKTRNDMAVIGWGQANQATWTNAVIVGGSANKVRAWGVVVWWRQNVAYEWWMVLGWNGNKAKKNSLAFWANVESEEWAFWWNATWWSVIAGASSARIDTANWTLIGTYKAIAGVNLVVSGAVKFEWKPLMTDPVKWEIRAVNECIYANDGHGWHVITRWVSADHCGDWWVLLDSCEFGNTLVWDGDVVEAFPQSYVPITKNWTTISSCSKKKIICYNSHMYEVISESNLSANLDKPADDYYAYCYKLN